MHHCYLDTQAPPPPGLFPPGNFHQAPFCFFPSSACSLFPLISLILSLSPLPSVNVCGRGVLRVRRGTGVNTTQGLSSKSHTVRGTDVLADRRCEPCGILSRSSQA